jgi:phosphoglycerol transferase
MLYSFFQILLLIFVAIVTISKIKNNIIKAIVTFVFSLFIILEIISFNMIDSFINYRFYSHFNINSISGYYFQFTSYFIYGFLSLLVIFATIYFLSNLVYKYVKNAYIYISIIIMLNLPLLLSNGIISTKYEIFNILTSKNMSFHQALDNLGMDSKSYITPSLLTATKGKNIIVISLESLEQGFIDSKLFENITPNLSKLSRNWTYYKNMTQSPGGGWTSASMYSYQVGVPAFFKGQGNDFFQNTSKAKITGLGHVLNKANYNNKYVIGNAWFAGMDDLLNTYGINVVSQNNCMGKYPISPAGLSDKDLFQEAKLQIESMDKNKPFALFLSTINTHFPNGIYDKRMEKYITPKSNNLEFSIASVDYLINNFIEYLKEQDLLDNTAIFIFPDHILGNSGSITDKLKKKERKLYLITNVSENKLSKKVSEKIFQIDLPRLIVDGAEINSNVKFLTDYISNNDINTFIKQNKIKITNLNSSSIEQNNFINNIKLSIRDNNLVVQSDNDKIKLKIKNKNDIVYDLTFTPEMVLINYKAMDINKGLFRVSSYDKKYKYLHLIVNILNGKITTSYLGNKQKVGIYKSNSELQYSKSEIDSICRSNYIKLNSKHILKQRKESKKIKFSKESTITVTSSEALTALKIKSNIQTINEKFNLKRGLNLISIKDNEVFILDNFDTYGNKKEGDRFIVKIKHLLLNKAFFTIVVHDAISNLSKEYQLELKNLGLSKLSNLSGRLAYISYVNSNYDIKEFNSKTTINKNISIFKTPSVDDIIQDIINFSNTKLNISLVSSEAITSYKIKSEIKIINSLNIEPKRGINLLFFDVYNNIKSLHYDTYENNQNIKKLLKKIKSFNNDFWAIVTHDSIGSFTKEQRESILDAGLKKLSIANGRMAYIAYKKGNNIIEKLSNTTVSENIIAYRNKITNDIIKQIKDNMNNKVNIQEIKNNNKIKQANIFRKDTNRFIAHAGAYVNGYYYTNSLESINANYNKGFRLFELDIIKTSDNIYVAAHDWKQWANKTKYTGTLPPSLKVFKEYKIFDKFTSMDINDINKWFKEHPDAILVTDKINEPIDFTKKFIDKKRLKMELFSWKAVDDAVKLGIKSVMPTMGIVNAIKGDKVKYLNNLGIKEIVGSRTFLKSNRGMIQSISNSGIKIYAFGLRANSGKDEINIVCNEQEYFYGLYADIWDFNKVLNCKK